MGRRSLAIGIGLIVAVAAAVGGTLAVTGLGEDGGAKPDGSETIVRLQAQEETVPCGAPAPVYIYLDDLESRPSPADETVSYGVSTFQLLLHYDPSVVRIAEPADIQLNPALSTEDADADGVVRSYFLLSNIDDGAGRAGVGFGSLVPSRGGDRNLEEGLDPVAKGEPLLLMTLRFLPVGHGTTAIELEPDDSYLPQVERVRLLDPSSVPHEPVRFRGSEITVEGGDCPEGPFATPKPTPLPTSTPGIEPEPTIEILTPMPVTPTPAVDAGRPDCNEQWNGYVDPQGYFSLCYPPNWRAISSPPQAYFGTTLSLSSPGGTLLTIYWSEFPSARDEPCRDVSNWRDVREATLQVVGRVVLACEGDATEIAHPNPEGEPPLRGTFAEIPLESEDGYVVLFLTEPGELSAPRSDETAALLGSIDIP